MVSTRKKKRFSLECGAFSPWAKGEIQDSELALPSLETCPLTLLLVAPGPRERERPLASLGAVRADTLHNQGDRNEGTSEL